MYGNYTVTDNRAYAASDFTVTSLAVPQDPRLPDGGGGTLQNVYYYAGPPRADDFRITLADDFGKRIEHWDGLDFTANARLERADHSRWREHRSRCSTTATW